MDYLRKMPLDPLALKDLVNYGKGMVVSRNIAVSDRYSVILLAFDEGESVSDEAYDGDVIYYAVDGDVVIVKGGDRTVIHQGEFLAVERKVLHAVEGVGRFKVLQMEFK